MTAPVPRHLAAFLAVAGSLLLAQAAAAQNFCVAPNASCGGTNVQTFQEALNLAAADTITDHVYLGAATYVAPDASGFHYEPLAAPVEIAGAGVGKTIITAPAGATNWTLRVTGGGALIHDLTVKLPSNVAAGYTGLKTDAWVEHVDVSEDMPQANLRSGVTLDPYGALRESTVAINNDGTNSSGVLASGGNTEIWASNVSGPTAVRAGYGALIDASRLIGKTGVMLYTGSTTINHSIIKFTGATSSGISAGSQPGADTTLRADGVVISGPGTGLATGIYTGTSPAWPQSVDATLVNSVIRGAPRPLFVSAAAGPGHAKLDASYSDFDPAGDTVSAGATLSLAHDTNLGTGARFVDAASGDFHLRTDSPLIDAGDPASLPTSDDLDLGPADLDGDGDGIARRDVGAYEAPAAPLEVVPQPPSAPGESSRQDQPATLPQPALDTQAPVLSRLARVRSSLRYKLSEAASVRITIQRRLVVHGQKRWRTTGRLTRAGLAGFDSVRIKTLIRKRGSYRVLARATDGAGNRSAVKRLVFRVGTR